MPRAQSAFDRNQPALEVHQLTKRYGAFRAVDSVSFNVPRGKIVGLLGPNGAGKTTTMQMLVGITLPDGGSIRYFGQDLHRHREACLQRINFSSSYNNLQSRITVWENLIVFARLYRVARPEAKIRELGGFFGITDLMNQRFLTLSAGQRTRVNLAKALLNDPEVVLMDEPTASLDPDIADRTLSLIESLRDSRELSIVYTSHQMDEITRICDEVVFLDRGRIVAQDTPAVLTRRIGNERVRVTFQGAASQVLEALNLHFAEVTLPAHNQVMVTTEQHRVAQAIFAIGNSGVEILDIAIDKPTLEDVFLQIARGTGRSPERIKAVLLQELYITARSMEVIVDLPFWSLMTVVVFGFVTKFLGTVMDPTIAQYLYMGTLMWEIIRITQYSMSLGALWNVWSHNFSNMFITPLSMPEYILAQLISAAIKTVVLFALVALVAAVLFDFNVLRMGLANLALLFLNLLCFGYSMGLLIVGIILRLGTRIQALAWGLVLVFQPLTAAYYPLSVMPPPLQAVARRFPPTYVFEAARASLVVPEIHWTDIGTAAIENVIYFGFAVWFFNYMYRRSRESGQFARNEE